MGSTAHFFGIRKRSKDREREAQKGEMDNDHPHLRPKEKGYPERPRQKAGGKEAHLELQRLEESSARSGQQFPRAQSS